MGRWAAETLRFALCLAIVLVGAYCAFEVSSFLQLMNQKLEYQYYEMRSRYE